MFQKRENENIFRVAEWIDGTEEEKVFTAVTPAHNSYSVSKSFTSTAIGMLEDRNLMSDEDTIDNFFDLSKYDSAYRKIKVRHLLNQTMGIENGFLFESDINEIDSYDWLDYIFKQPLKYAPDKHMAYSNSTYYLLSRIVEKVSGQDLGRFLEENLFRKIGLRGWAWEQCPLGYSFGATGLYASTKDLVKFGRMYLQNGMFNDRQIVSEKWVKKATSKNPLSICGTYNYGFRILEDGTITCIGAHGQTIVISKEKKAVVAAHAFEDSVDVCVRLKEYIDKI